MEWNCRNTKMTSSHGLNPNLKMRGAIPPKICTYSGNGIAFGRARTSVLRTRRPGNRCSIPGIGREFLLSYHVKAGTEPQQAGSSIGVLFPGIERSRRETYQQPPSLFWLRMRGAMPLFHPTLLCFVVWLTRGTFLWSFNDTFVSSGTGVLISP